MKDFKTYLKKEKILFSEKDGKIIITENQKDVCLRDLTGLPSRLIFKNKGNVYFFDLTTAAGRVIFYDASDINSTPLSGCIEFYNQGEVCFYSSEELLYDNKGKVISNKLLDVSNGFVFKNEGEIYLFNLTDFPPKNIFNNQGSIYLAVSKDKPIKAFKADA